MITLRPYQILGLEQIKAAFRNGHRAPIYVAPTGSGKTALFSAIAHGAATKRNRVLILSHRIELIDQISDALSLSDTPHGYIAAGYPRGEYDCMIASVPTLIRRLDRVREPALIICDEAHHARSATFERCLTHWPRAKLLGVTATPVRTSGEGLDKLFDHLVVGPSVRELTESGFLAPARVFAPPTVDVSGLHRRGGDYAADESAALMDRPTITGDAISHYQKHARALPALAFCVSVEHARHTAAQFREAGFSAVTLDGKTDRQIRRGVMADFRAGKIQVLTSCDLFSEGLDCPGVQVGIMLRPTQSLGLHCQQIGRILRPAPGKSHALILDHVDNVGRFGLPDEPRTWTLSGTTDRRAASDDAAPSVRVCPRCFAAQVSGKRSCQHCGYDFPVESRSVAHADGELAEITPEELARRAALRDRRREQGRADSLEALIEVGTRRGMRNPAGWARHVLQAREAKRMKNVSQREQSDFA
jgi:DNA repair protein RadD